MHFFMHFSQALSNREQSIYYVYDTMHCGCKWIYKSLYDMDKAFS